MIEAMVKFDHLSSSFHSSCLRGIGKFSVDYFHIVLQLYEACGGQNPICQGVASPSYRTVYKHCLKGTILDELSVRQALWTRFFPVSVEIRQRLARGEVGEVQLVRADLGAPLTHIPRLAERELGGGAVLDLGVYCLQFVFMVFNGEKPESVYATGSCLDTGTAHQT